MLFAIIKKDIYFKKEFFYQNNDNYFNNANLINYLCKNSLLRINLKKDKNLE
jgi:hypothetical protein